MKQIYPGSKYFRYIDDELEIIRVFRVKQSAKKVKYWTSDHEVKTMSFDELEDWTMLSADGIINSIIVKSGDYSDVIVTLSKLPNETGMPQVICRQGILDIFTDKMKKNMNVSYIGASVSQETCPAEIEFTYLLACDSIVENFPTVVYLDDTFEDIISLISSDRIDKVLANRAMTISRVDMARDSKTLGSCSTLRELLESNKFIYDFRKCFSIIEVPFSIDPDSDELDDQNTDYLGNAIGTFITETYMIPYSKEINLKNFNRDYVLISSAADNYNKIYIVGYDSEDDDA